MMIMLGWTGTRQKLRGESWDPTRSNSANGRFTLLFNSTVVAPDNDCLRPFRERSCATKARRSPFLTRSRRLGFGFELKLTIRCMRPVAPC